MVDVRMGAPAVPPLRASGRLDRPLAGASQVPKTLIRIQVLRALAAAAVALHHAQHDAGTLASQFGQSFRAWNPIPWSAGVDVFFVISGLIMVHASQPLFAQPGGARTFLTRRIARILPVYWVATTLYIGVALLAPALLNQSYVNPSFVIASYLFIPAARPDGVVQPIYELGWTLNYEMLFYVLFAAAIALPLRWAATALLGTLVTLVAVGRLAAPLPQPFGFWTDPILLEFGFGVAVGCLVVRDVRLPGWAGASLAGAGLAALMLAAAFTDGSPSLSRPLVYGVPAALIVAAAALTVGGKPGGRLAAWGAAAGDASYALYLFHPFVLRATRIAFGRSGLAAHLGPWAYIATALAASLGVALLSYRFFEKPLTRHVRRLLGGDKGRARPAPAMPIAPGSLPEPRD